MPEQKDKAPSDPSLPPLLAGHRRPACEHPFDAAVSGAEAGRYSAGDLLWSESRSHLRIALVLEPDVPPTRCAEMLFLAMVASTDAIGTLIPPEVALTYVWPATLRANGARVGRARFRQSADLDEEGAPLWLVVGIEMRLAPVGGDVEPGEIPHLTSLSDEGAADLDGTLAVEALARHLMTWLHTWEVEGFGPVVENWLFRADGYKGEVVLPDPHGDLRGTFLGLDEAGNLLLRPMDAEPVKVVAVPLDRHLDQLDRLDSLDAALALHSEVTDR